MFGNKLPFILKVVSQLLNASKKIDYGFPYRPKGYVEDQEVIEVPNWLKPIVPQHCNQVSIMEAPTLWTLENTVAFGDRIIIVPLKANGFYLEKDDTFKRVAADAKITLSGISRYKFRYKFDRPQPIAVFRWRLDRFYQIDDPWYLEEKINGGIVKTRED